MDTEVLFAVLEGLKDSLPHSLQNLQAENKEIPEHEISQAVTLLHQDGYINIMPNGFMRITIAGHNKLNNRNAPDLAAETNTLVKKIAAKLGVE